MGGDAPDDGLVGNLYRAIVHCRLIKSKKEIALLRHIYELSSEAHLQVMRRAQPGMHEFQLESIFRHWCHFCGGARLQAYTCICGCGSNGSVLHYGHAGAPNDAEIKNGSMCLLDMGCELYCYSSDITCSFPISGKFTEDQKGIYRAVEAMQDAVFAAAKPGVHWKDMHLLSNRILLEHPENRVTFLCKTNSTKTTI